GDCPVIEPIRPRDLRSKSKSESKSKPKTNSMTSAPEARRALFGEPQLLPGEDPADYNHLLTAVRATVKPVDIIEEIYLNDVVSLEWEVLRWRRLNTALVRTRGLAALESFLKKEFNYDCASAHFADWLAGTLQNNCPEVTAEEAQTLACQ